MKNCIGSGNKIDVVATAAILSGQVLKVGSLIVVAVKNAAIGETVVCERRGAFTLPKKAADVVTQGQLLYWDDAAKNITITAAGGTLAGYANKDAAAATTTVEVILG